MPLYLLIYNFIKDSSLTYKQVYYLFDICQPFYKDNFRNTKSSEFLKRIIIVSEVQPLLNR